MKKKLNNVGKQVGGRFFTVERQVRNKVERYCARFVSESAKYITISDVNTGSEHKMSKDNIVSLSCGSFSV